MQLRRLYVTIVTGVISEMNSVKFKEDYELSKI